jgi:hypothetical protein
MASSQAQFQQQASLTILKKAMDQGTGNAEFLNKMLAETDLQAVSMQHAAQPHLGGNIDLKG